MKAKPPAVLFLAAIALNCSAPVYATSADSASFKTCQKEVRNIAQLDDALRNGKKLKGHKQRKSLRVALRESEAFVWSACRSHSFSLGRWQRKNGI